MTLGPRDIFPLSEEDEDYIQDLLSTFDNFLKNNYTGTEGDEGLRFYFNDADQNRFMVVPTFRLLNEIFHRYRRAGWSEVTYEYDEGTGPYIRFMD